MFLFHCLCVSGEFWAVYDKRGLDCVFALFGQGMCCVCVAYDEW